MSRASDLTHAELDLLHLLAAGHLRHGAPERALPLLLVALRGRPDDRRLILAVAYAFLEIGELDQAEAALDRLEQEPPPALAPHGALLRSHLLYRRGDLTAARLSFQRFIALREQIA